MKKLLLTLTAIAGIIGCSGEIRIESKPSEPASQPRLTVIEHDTGAGCPWVYVIKDTENDVEYLCVRTGAGLAVAPMIKKEVKVENE